MSTAMTSHFKGAASLVLTLPFSFSLSIAQAHDVAPGHAALMQSMAVENAVLEGWYAYAQASIVPDFEWAERTGAKAPDLLSVSTGTLSRRQMTAEDRLGVNVGYSRTSLREAGRGGRNSFAPMHLEEAAPLQLRQEIFSPGVLAATRFGQVELGAVFVYQHFASWDMGGLTATEVGLGLREERNGRTESSFGHGIQLGWSGQFGADFDYRFDYRSKVDMDAFNTFIGAYSAPGEFDLPGQVGAEFGYRLTPRTRLAVGVEQVHYSQVRPFLDSGLPNRVLALLGDGGGAQFRWRDLTIYSAQWQWSPTDADTFSLRYSTRQQPTPTSPAVRNALATDYTDNNFAVSWARRLTPGMQLGISASYAPASYFLGYPDLFGRSFSDGSQVEGEIVLTALF